MIYALPGETWEEYYTRFQEMHGVHFAFARSFGISGLVSAIGSFGTSAAIYGSERLVSDAARRTFTSFGRGGFAYVRGYHKTLALGQVASGLRTAATASTAVTVSATTYGWGLWVNARISYLLTRQE